MISLILERLAAKIFSLISEACNAVGTRIPTLNRPFHIHEYVKYYKECGREETRNKIIETIRNERGGWLVEKYNDGNYKVKDNKKKAKGKKNKKRSTRK